MRYRIGRDSLGIEVRKAILTGCKVRLYCSSFVLI